MKIGVLALQGAFREHVKLLESLGADAPLVKRDFHLEGLDGLVIPGGESTTIGRLLREYNLMEPIRERASQGFPLFGTCAGMIVLANQIEGAEEPHLAVMNMKVNRNSFGRQRESFEADLEIPVIGSEPFPAVFIRAPHVVEVGEHVEVLCCYNDRMVAVQEGNLLALSFHPELTGDARLHRHFLTMVESAQVSSAK
ncbi:pyridoxal 5'-phosphate synthase glutaminase subunit PdxT [Alicyclobacillus sp. SO9]|uniref:pyridoxal 5'-phosphate synthase glutaminase subunit PdxT n=1 Tax=Alicyclobacillus sp. SO9 TaxID=2665646 RepID=UPI0018E85066|nr:pyridoxal 5'-phosphate synthase glutaminase subunit PdxT [Alicyclobacillus sp. SO9]QQE78968.1 pyridoxal 5'-phosphate synthase glutaminase subunit PdxT [Alicyclobacillus sp. SO9]